MADPLLPAPDDVDFSASPASFALAQRQAVKVRALTALDDSTDDATRADELSRATGAKPALVYGDLENFERQHKATLTSNILENNQYLRDYVAAHPLAAKVSNDDWGGLDAYTQALSKVGLPTKLGRAIAGAAQGVGADSILKKGIEGFNEGFSQDAVEPEVHKLLGNNVIADAFLSVIQTNPAYYAPRIMQGLMTGGAAAGGQLATNLTGSEAWGQRLTRDLLIAPQVAIPELGGAAVPAELQALAQKSAAKVEPWVRMNKVPPPGVDETVDKLHAEQVKLDMKNIDEAHQALQGTGTLERSPDLAALLGRQVTNGEIGINAEAVRKLYGGKPGEPIETTVDDGKLGFVPNLAEQLALAEKHGGDISVPLAEWNAKVDPETHKELHDFIRPRPEGMNLDEVEKGKEAKEAEELDTQPPVNAVEAIRHSAALAEKIPKLEGEEAKGILPSEVTQGEVMLGPNGEETAPAQTFPAKEALAQIDKERLTGVPRALAEFFEDRLQKMAGDTPVWVVDPATMTRINEDLGHPLKTPGFYHPAWHAIMMASDIAGGELGHDVSAHVLIHELAHAATHRELGEFPVLRLTVKQLMSETDKFLNETDRQSREYHDYAFKNESEFIAEAFSNPRFQNVLATTPISNELAGKLKLHAKSSNVWDAVRGIVRNLIERLLGKPIPDTILDGVLKLGPVFEEAGKRIKEGKPQAALADPETRIRGLMPKKQLEAYLEKIAKQQQEDIEFQQKQAEKRATETQTKEWQANEKEMKEKVREDMRNRPDIAADRFLREHDIDPSKLKPLEADALGARYGYPTGEGMLTALQSLKQQRDLEGLTPASHLTKLVGIETEHRMRKEYGTLEESIAREAEDHVISPTQIDLLHDKMLALGMAAKVNEPLQSVANMRIAIRELFDRSPMAAHSVSGYLATAGRAGNRMRNAFLEDDITGAFKAQQEQVHSLLLADEAKKLEKQQRQYDKLVKNLSQREPRGLDPEYANWAQEILMHTGAFVRRSVQDLERQRGLISQHTDLRSFVESVNNKGGFWNSDPDAMPVGQQMPVAEFLLDGRYPDPEKITVEEWRAVLNALKTLDKNGRGVSKYNKGEEKLELEEVKKGLIDRLKAAVDGKKINITPDQPTSVMRTIGSWILNPETWFNRLDLGNRRGPFNQLIMRPIVEGQYDLKTLERQYAKEWRDIGEFGDLRKKIDNPLFKDTDGTLLSLNRGNLMSILSNMGNALQRKKLAGGYGIDNPDRIWQWLFTPVEQGGAGITREDFKRAQKMGDFFSDIFTRSEKMYSELSGVTPERIELGTVQTPWGEEKEWYHPLIPNPLKHGPEINAKSMMEESGYYRPATATGYTKKRTGAIYPIQLDFDAIPGKIKQMLNDIAMHPAISEVSKIILDRKFRDAFTQYYGKEYSKALEPWLKDAAGQGRYTPAADATMERAVGYLRENMSTLLIGFNLGTVLKHAPTALAFSMREVGPVRFMDSMFHMLHETDEGKTRWRFAMDNSEELQNRLRSTRESISATNQDLFRQHDWNHKFFTARDAIQTLGATPVAMSDFMSAVPMWDAAYRQEMEKPGTTHGDAVYLANTAVRRTHGSSIITNRPAAMRMNSWVQTFMPFYNFFNNAAQRNYEFMWKSKLALQGRDLPEMTGFEKEQYAKGLKHIPEILGGFLTFGVIVSMVEQAVDPLQPDPNHPIKQGAKIITRGPASMVPGLRDIVNGAYGGHEPSAGLLGTFYQDIAKPFVTHISDPARAFKNANAAFGALTGLTYGAVGNVGQYVYNIATGKEVPQDPLDLVSGYRHGTQRERRR